MSVRNKILSLFGLAGALLSGFYFLVEIDARQAQIHSAINGTLIPRFQSEQVTRAVKPGLSFTAVKSEHDEHKIQAFGEALSASISTFRARARSADRASRAKKTQAFQRGLESLRRLDEQGKLPSLIYGPGQNLRAVSGHFVLEGNLNPSLVEGFVSEHSTVFGLSDHESPKISKVQQSLIGAVYHIDRQIDNMPVWGRQLVVSESDGRIVSITGDMRPLPMLDMRATLDEGKALAIAEQGVPNWSGLRTSYRSTEGIFLEGDKAHRAYRIELVSSANKAWDVYVSINTQTVLSVIPKYYESSASSGIDLGGVSRNFNSYFSESDDLYLLYDATFPEGSDGTSVGVDDPASNDHRWATSQEADSGWLPSAVSAIHNAKLTYDYFDQIHGRKSFGSDRDGKPLPLVAIVEGLDEDGSGLDNAYWYGGLMFYGKGETLFKNLAGALDVAAHEFGHGVVEYTANLRYHNQSGALNESFADLFGVMVDRENWLLGETLFDDGRILRDMANPMRGGQPAHFDDFAFLPDTPEGDQGGVHINSGIQNRALYLIAEGLTKEGLGNSLGREKVEQIAYQALLRLGENSEFIDSFVQMKLVAEALYGESAALAVEEGWRAVGIAETTVPASDDRVIEFSLASGSDAVAHLYARDGTFDYAEDDSYDIYVYYGEGLTTREEYISDNHLGPINEYDAGLVRPALYSELLEDGTTLELVIYVSDTGELVLADVYNAYDDEIVPADFAISSVAISPDGSRIVVVPSDTRYVAYVSLVSDEVGVFEVLGPNYSAGVTQSPVERVDSTSFDFTGTKVIFDFLSCRANFDGSDCIQFWSIGIVDIDSGAFDYPFPGQDEYIDLGYPQFSNVSDGVFVFDFIDYRDGDSVDSLVLAYDRTKNVFTVAGSGDPESKHGGIYSLPTLRGSDESVIYQYYYVPDGEDVVGQDLLYSMRLNSNYEYQLDGSDFLFNFNGGYAESHRTGLQDIAADLVVSNASYDFGEVAGQETVETMMSVTNTGSRSIEINNVQLSENLRTNLTSTILRAGESLTFLVGLKPSDISVGTYNGSLSLDHDGDSAKAVILVTATIVSADATDGVSDSGGDSGSPGDDQGGDAGSTDASSGDTGGGLDDDGGPDSGTGGGGSEDDGSTDAGSSDGGTDSTGISEAVLDIDGDGQQSALSDGLLVIRYFFGFQGASLTNGAISAGASRNSAEEIIAAIESVSERLDVDDDGETRALTDGLLIIRYLFGFSGEALLNGAVGSGSSLSAAEILSNLKSLEGSDSATSDDSSGGMSSGDGVDMSDEGDTAGSLDTGGDSAGSADGGAGGAGGGSSGEGGDDGASGNSDADGDGLLDSLDPEPGNDNTPDLEKYEWVNLRKTWQEAKAYAEERGYDLVSITSAREAQLVYALIASQFNPEDYASWGYAPDGGGAVYVWLGASDLEQEGMFVWESGEDFDFENWGSIEPDDYEGQDALALALEDWPVGADQPLGKAGQWNDIDHLNNMLTFIIERRDNGTHSGGGEGGSSGDSGVESGGYGEGGSGDTTSGTGDNGSTSTGETSGGDTDSSGGTIGDPDTLIDVSLSIRYERVFPVCSSSLSCALDYENSAMKPARYVDVTFYDGTTKQPLGNFTELETDGDGNLNIALKPEQPFYFVVSASTSHSSARGSWSVRVKDNGGSPQSEPKQGYPLYASESDVFTVGSEPLQLSFELKSGWNGSGYGDERSSAPFAILDSVIDAMLGLTDESTPLEFPALDVFWSTKNRADATSIGSSYYDPEAGVIRILGDEDVDTDEFDHHVVIHEWGHYFQEKLSRDSSIGGVHLGGELLDPRLAYSEGWANALSGLIIGDQAYKDTSGARQSSGFSVPLEREGEFESIKGWFSEESVGRIVFDAFDREDDLEDQDSIHLDLITMSRLMTDQVTQQEGFTTIYNFAVGLLGVVPDSKSQILALLAEQKIGSGLQEVDVFGTGELNDGSSIANASGQTSNNGLPLYLDLSVDDTSIEVCQDRIHGVPNKLSNRRFLKFEVTEPGTYTLSVATIEDSANGSDPDFLLWGKSGLVASGESSSEGNELVTLALEPGGYWFELYDYALLSQRLGITACQMVQVVRQ